MTDVVMPQMGESIVEGTLTKWLKKAGETVVLDEPLFEISTDKVDTEIPSPAAEVLSEVLVQEGQTVQVNAVVARIAGEGAAAPPKAEAVQPKTEPDPVAEPVAVKTSPSTSSDAPPVAATVTGPLSPLVRRMARENNIDLSKISGTGAGGRITRDDVRSVYEGRGSRSGQSCSGSLYFLRRSAAGREGHGSDREDARGTDVDDAPEDRRAHDHEQTHVGSCHHGAPRRYDEGCEDARAA